MRQNAKPSELYRNACDLVMHRIADKGLTTDSAEYRQAENVIVQRNNGLLSYLDAARELNKICR